MTLGELTASISHEVNQPLAAVVINGQICLRLLALETPRPDDMRATVERIVRDANRASDVLQRIRALAKGANRRWSRWTSTMSSARLSLWCNAKCSTMGRHCELNWRPHYPRCSAIGCSCSKC